MTGYGAHSPLSTKTAASPQVALTVDIEDYYHATAFDREIPRTAWDSQPSRIEKNTWKVLDLFSEFRCRATFFVLGWVAVRHADLVREIHRRGHEVASHGFDHRLVYSQGAEEFREDVSKSKGILEDACGAPVAGYRAPTFSITRQTPWAHKILAEEGYGYSSSVFPVHHDRYGWPEFPETPTRIPLDNGREIWEFPLSTTRFLRLKIPFGGGGYLRIYPLWLTRYLLRMMAQEDGLLPILYFHPWELDHGQPVLPRGRLNSLRHSYGQADLYNKLRDILADHDFQPISSFFHRALSK